MYQLLIADDEKIIREGLKNVVEWKELGYEIADIFTDGQEIIEYLEYAVPDVILTDIKMSHISGIDIAKYVFDHKLPCKVVLVSGYQEFELALSGIKYGAEDYLLKPIDVDNLTTTFSKIKEELDQKRQQDIQAQEEKDRMQEAIPLLEERFFSDLILGVAGSEEYIKSRMAVLYPQMDINHCHCLLADIQIKNYQDFMENVWQYNYDQFEINIIHFLQIWHREMSFHLVFKSGEMLEVFGVLVKQSGGTEACEVCRREMNSLVQELMNSFQFQADYEIKQIYPNIFEINRIQERLFSQGYSEESLKQHLQEKKKLIMSNISLGNMVTAQKIFHSIMDELSTAPSIFRNNFVIEILSTMNTVIKEVNVKLSDSLRTYFNYSLVLSFHGAEEVKAYCDRIFDRIKLAEEKKEYYDTTALISKAKRYIADHIDKDISQEETANQLFICSSYLSRLFKKQTGENFTQYVTKMKMEKAVELLKDPQYKTYQVSEALGYKTPRYFSRLFRMQTGMNPSEYRGKVLNIGGVADESEQRL